MDVLCLCPVSGLSIALCPMSCLVSVSCPVSLSCLWFAQRQCPVSGSCLIHGVNKTAGKASYLTEQTFIWLVRTRQGYFQAFLDALASLDFKLWVGQSVTDLPLVKASASTGLSELFSKEVLSIIENIFFGRVMHPHHSDQPSVWSSISWAAQESQALWKLFSPN